MSTVIGIISLILWLIYLWGGVATSNLDNHKMAAVYLAIAAWCFH